MKVELSYEERIMNAIHGLPRAKGEHFLARDQREHAAIRAILQPLYNTREELERDLVALANRAHDTEESLTFMRGAFATMNARAEAAERLNGDVAGALERLLAFVGYACDYRDGTNTDPATCPGDPPYVEGPCATCEACLVIARIESASAKEEPTND